MVNYSAIPLDRTFSALADPTRRAILVSLMRGSATVNEIASPFEISLPAISKHLKVLEKAGLLIRRKEGRTLHCSLNAAPLQEAVAWITLYEQFWEDQFDALADFVENNSIEENE